MTSDSAMREAAKVAVFGLGYVGSVTAACLASNGFDVTGVDVDRDKVDALNSGKPLLIEPGLDELVQKGLANSRLRATTDARSVSNSDVFLICVGTPSLSNGDVELKFVHRVAQEIGALIRSTEVEYPVVCVRSTVPPGTIRELVIPALEAASGLSATADFGVAMNPEFLREGSSIDDYQNPARSVIGANDERTRKIVESLAPDVEAPIANVDYEAAELIKYIDNSWHALKVTFANEVGRLAKTLNQDARKVMEVFCLDTKLNISTSYLRPGLAFGGSCLPKDLRALGQQAHLLNVDIPLIRSVLPSNEAHIGWTVDTVISQGNRKVGILGISFKSTTDDLRESPMVEVVERLAGKGFDVRIFDPLVALSAIIGSNREYLLRRLPHVSALMVDSLEEIIEHSDTLVIATEQSASREVLHRRRPDQVIVDLAGIVPRSEEFANYQGICW